MVAATALADLSPQDLFGLFVAKYWNDRVAFVREVFQVKKIEQWQVEELKALDKGATRLSIRSGHGVGKTAFLSWTILHFLFTRFPCKVAITAPSAPQLFDALASEVKSWLKTAETAHPVLAGILYPSSDRIVMVGAEESVFASYRTSRKDNPEALQGIHSDNVLLIADEASGVDQAVFEAAAGSMSTHGAITILTGNPTRSTGFFYQTHTMLRHIWRVRRVSCFESSRVSKSFTDEERAFGEESNRWRIRVLGEFPKGDDDTLIARHLVEGACERKIVPPRKELVYWGVDVARFGSDASALAKRKGNVIPEPVKRWRGINLMQLCGHIVNEFNAAPEGDKPEAIFVDVIGLGAGVVDRLRELEMPVVGINVSELPSFSMSTALRLRDELWCHVRDWFASLNTQFPIDDIETVEEICEVRVAYTSSGRTQIESKNDMRSRGVGSPDGGDAVCLTFARGPAIGAGAMAGTSKKGPLKRKDMRRV